VQKQLGIVPHQVIWSWYTGRWWVGCYIWYSEEPRYTKCNSPPINRCCAVL